MWAIGGEEYGTAAQVMQRWPGSGITAARLRAWVHTGWLPLVTAGELAAALGAPAPADPHAPARVRGPRGPENLYRWRDVVDARFRAGGGQPAAA